MDSASVSGRPFEVLLLGPPRIRWKGQPYRLAGRQNRLLVYYLAVSHRLVERRSLENLIWSAETQTDIGRQVRQALSRLRRALPDRNLLIESKDQLNLDWDQAYCDVSEFEHLLSASLLEAESKQRSVPLSEPAVVDTMYRAVNLWHGTRLLESMDLSGSPGLEEWFIQQEHTLESGRRWLLERLSDHESASHRALEALQLAQAALVGNELDENLHERILNLLLRTGQRSQARRHYERMLRGFKRDGMQPNQALEQIGAQLESLPRRKNAVPRTSSSGRNQEQPVKSPASDPVWHVFRPGDEPFIGRMMILDTLVQIAQRGGGVLIYGESGQGKTRLLKEFYAHLAPPPRLVLVAAQSGENTLPFQPLITALLRQVSPTEWLQLPTTWASYLSILFPELHAKRTGLRTPNTENPELTRSHIYRAFSELFTLLAERQPDKRLVLVLDDAHWADEETLRALVYLHSHAPFNQHSLMVLAARIEEANPSLAAYVQDLRKNERFDLLKMHNLSEPAVAQLVKHYIQGEANADFVHHLFRATGGNPLYIIEIMRNWYLNALPNPAGTLGNTIAALPMPDSLLDLMQYRLNGLPPDARRLLEMISILGDEIDPHRLHRLADQMDWPDIHLAMDQLIQSGLITQRDSATVAGAGTFFTFTHEKFREAALLSMPAGQASLLHLQAAAFLEQGSSRQISDQAARIAQHYEAGGNLPAAFRYWVWAAKQSMRLSAWDTALQQNTHCDALLDICIGAISDNDLYLFYQSWTNALNTTNDSEALDDLSARLHALGTRHNRPILLGLSLHIKTVAAFTRNEIESGLEHVQGYQQYMEQSGQPEALAEVFTRKGVLYYMMGRIKESLESLRKSQEILATLSSTNLNAREQALSNEYEIGIAETLGGRPLVGYEHALTALNGLETTGSPTMITFSHGTAALASIIMGLPRQGLHHGQEGLSMAHENRAMRAIGYLSLYTSMCQVALGDLDGCLENLEIAEAFGRRFERREIYSFANSIRGDIFLQLGDYEQAAIMQEKAYAENSDLFAAPDYQVRASLARMMALEDIGSETSQALRRHVHELKALVKQHGLGLTVCYASHYEMTYLARRREWAALRALVDQEQPNLAVNSLMPMWHYANLLLAQADFVGGNYEGSMQRATETVTWGKQTGFLWFEIMAFRLQIQVRKQLDQTMPAGLTLRLDELLSHLREHSQHELVRQSVERFCLDIAQKIPFLPRPKD